MRVSKRRRSGASGRVQARMAGLAAATAAVKADTGHNGTVPTLTATAPRARRQRVTDWWTRLRPALPGVAAWAVAVAVLAPLVLRYLTSPPDQRLIDLDVYRTGGISVLRGQPVYRMLTQVPQLLPFTYPPIAAVLAVPLALTPWTAAQLVWLGFIYLPLAITIRYAFRPMLTRAGRCAPVLWAGVFAVCACLFPLRDQMRFGQVDILLVALCVADCAAPAPRWPRGALIGLATAVKLVPGVFIIYLLISGRARAARTAVVAFAAWTIAAFVLLPRDSLFYWTNAIFDSNRLGSNTGTSNQSLRGIILRQFLPAAAPGAVWLAAAAVVGVAGFLTARRMARGHGDIAGVAITGLLAVLLSPVAWIHHLAWVVVAIGAVAGDGRDRRRVVVATVITVFYTVTLPWWGLSLLKMGWLPKPAGRLVQDSFGLGAVALIAVIAWAHRRGLAAKSAADQVDQPRPAVSSVAS
jgi:alpha-1,2-mannosyltransferase